MVVIGYSFWQRRFAGDPKIIGQESHGRGQGLDRNGRHAAGWKFPIQKDNVDYIAPLLPMFSGQTPNYICGAARIFFPSLAV